MKKTITQTTKSWFSRLMLLAVFLVVGTAAKAADPIYVDVELGKAIEQPAMTKVYATFVAPETGVLTVKGNNTYLLRPFSDAECKTPINVTVSTTSDGGSVYEMNVEEGKTYYFYKFNMMSAYTTTTFSMGGDEALTAEITPAQDQAFDITGSGRFSVQFSKPATFDQVLLTIGSKTQEILEGINLSGNFLSVDLKSVISEWVKAGDVKAGDPMTVKITGIRAQSDNSIIYGEDGTLTANYTCPAAPVELTNSKYPSTFLSYFAPNNADGKIVLTFDGELLADNAQLYATLSYGELASGGTAENYYSESLPVSVSGNVLTADLTGKLRTPANMLPDPTKTYENISVKIGGVKGADGSFAASTAQGSVGSYTFTMPYKEVKADILSEFTPASGASLQGVESIELWYSGESSISYDGVTFTYVDGTATKSVNVSMDQITKEVDGEDATLTIPVPAELQGKQNITVTLTNVVYADGLEHNISARYDAFVVTVNTPAETTLEGLPKGTLINVTVNSDEVNVLYYSITQVNLETGAEDVVKTNGPMTKDTPEGNTFTGEILSAVKMLQNCDYRFEFRAYKSDLDYGKKNIYGTDTHIVHGATLPYQFSDILFESITPDPETILTADDNVFTVTFDGLVTMDATTTFINMGQGMGHEAFESIEPQDPTTGEDGSTLYSNIWTLTVSKSFMESVETALDISFAATDADGRRVQGPLGVDEGSYFYYSYMAPIAAPDPVLSPASGETVESLYQIMVDNVGGKYAGIAFANQVQPSDAVLYDRSMGVAAHVVSVQSYIPEEHKDSASYVPTRVILTLDKEITEPGGYMLEIPALYFIMGDQMMSVMSKAITATYTIEDESEGPAKTLVPASVNPENGSTVTSLSEIVLSFAGEVAPNYNVATPVSVYNKETGELVTTGTVDFDPYDFFNLNDLYIMLDDEITAEGVYEVVVAEGACGDSEFDATMGEGGTCNAEFTLTYGIGKTTGINNAVANEGVYKVYSLTGVLVLTTTDKAALNNLPAGIYVVNGKKVYLP